jgi:hypothetical protein
LLIDRPLLVGDSDAIVSPRYAARQTSPDTGDLALGLGILS